MDAHWKMIGATTKSVAKKPKTLKAKPILIQLQEDHKFDQAMKEASKLALNGSKRKLLQRNRMRD